MIGRKFDTAIVYHDTGDAPKTEVVPLVIPVGSPCYCCPESIKVNIVKLPKKHFDLRTEPHKRVYDYIIHVCFSSTSYGKGPPFVPCTYQWLEKSTDPPLWLVNKLNRLGIVADSDGSRDVLPAVPRYNIYSSIERFVEGKIPCGERQRVFTHDQPNYWWGPSDVPYEDEINGRMTTLQFDPRGKAKELIIRFVLKAGAGANCRPDAITTEVRINFKNDEQGMPIGYGVKGKGVVVTPPGAMTVREDFPCEIPDHL